MKSQFRLLCATFLSLSLLASANLDAQEIWSGSAVSFSKANGGSPSLPSNQDRLTPQTWLTRANTAGLFNIVTETGFGGGSPANTRWAFDLAGNGNTGLAMLASNHTALTFESWRDAVNSNPPSSVGIPGVLHLISEDIYVDLMFTSWQAGGGGGGFAYLRGGPSASLATRIAGSNPNSLTSSLPVIGSNLTITVNLALTGHSFVVISLHANQMNVPLVGGQVLLAGGPFLGRMGPKAGPMAVFNAMVPNDISLAGTTVSLQAIQYGGVTPFAISNAVDLTAGF